MNTNHFVNKFRATLEFNAVDKVYEREKSGLLNSKRIGRFGSSDRIFKKRSVEKLEKEYSISVLMDASGSMERCYDDESSMRYEAAYKCSKELFEVFDKVGINYEVVLFGTTDIVIKSYSQAMPYDLYLALYGKFQIAQKSVRYFQKGSDVFDLLSELEPEVGLKSKGYKYIFEHDFKAHNPDAIFIARAYDRILNQPGKKIILTFSDGAPTLELEASSIRGKHHKLAEKLTDSSVALKFICNQIHKEKEATLIGIGIQTDHVRRYYDIWARVESEEDMRNELIRLLSKTIYKV